MSGSISSNLQLGIDAGGAKAGSDQFSAAIQAIAQAADALDRKTDIVFSKLRSKISGVNFAQIARDINSIGTVRVDAGLSQHLTTLGRALANFRGPSADVASRLTGFASALRTLHNPAVDPMKLTEVSKAITGFRAPSQQQTKNLQDFVAGLNSLKITANVSTITSQLAQITTAARQASDALRGVRELRATTRTSLPSSGGGGYRGGNGGGQYGPRSSILSGPYDGIFSGHNRATGELRGMENIANPAFQSASILRSMVPALTAGEMFRSLYDEGTKLTQFQHVLEVATTVPENAIESQHRLAESMQFVSDMSMKYGMNLTSMREGFSHFAVSMHAAGYTLQETKKNYESITSTMRALGVVEQEKQEQVFHAINTILAMDRISMIQVHRQLDPVLPGIQQELAKVVFRDGHHLGSDAKLDDKQMETAQQELVKLTSKGLVRPEAILVAMHNMQQSTLPGLATALESPTSAMERFKTQWVLTEDMMNKSGVWKAMGEEMDHLARILQSDNMQDMFRRLALGIADVLHDMGTAAEWAANHIDLLIGVFKVFVGLSVIEFTARLGGAFSNTAAMVEMLISPMVRATKAAREFMAVQEGVAGAQAAAQAAAAAGARAGLGAGSKVVAGAETVANGWTLAEADAAAAAAAGASATRLAVIRTAIVGVGEAALALITPFTAIAAAVVGTFAAAGYALYAGQDDLVKYGGTTVTVGGMMKTFWINFKQSVSDVIDSIGGIFRSVWSGMQDFGAKIGKAILGDTMTWAQAIMQVIANIGAATHNIGEAMSHPVGFLESAFGITRKKGVTGSDGPHFMTADEWMGQYAKQTKDRQDAEREAERAKNAPFTHFQNAADTETGKPHSIIGTALPKEKHGKSEAEKAQDALDGVLKALTPNLALFETFVEEMAKIAKAQQMGVHSKGALEMAKTMSPAEGKAYLAGEYDRARDAAKEKTLNSADAVSPYTKALKDMQSEEEKLQAIVAAGVLTQDQANQVLARKRETLEKTLDPYGTYLKALQKEIGLLTLGNRERQVQSALEAEIKKAKDNGSPLDNGQIAVLERQLQLKQQLEIASANQNTGLQAWRDTFQDMDTELGKIEEKISGDLTDAITKFLEAPRKFSQDHGWQKMGQQMVGQLLHSQVQQTMGAATDLLGLTGGANADPHGSTLLAPLFHGNIGGIGYQAAADRFKGQTEAMGASPLSPYAEGNALRVLVTNGAGGAAAGGATGTAFGSGASSGLPGSLSHAAMGASMAPGGGAGGQPNFGDQMLSKLPFGGLFQQNGLLGSQGDLFGKTGLFGSEGLFGSQGPIRGDESLSQFADKAFGSTSWVGSGGPLSGLFGGTAPATQATSALASGVQGPVMSSADATADGLSESAGGLGDMFSSIGSGIGSIASSIGSIFAAEGGYTSGGPIGHAAMPASLWLGRTVPHYAEGTGNTSGGIPSVLHPNEAVIPLSRGRKIPVEMANGAGQSSSAPIHIHYNISTPDADSFRASQGQIHTDTANAMQRAQRRNG